MADYFLSSHYPLKGNLIRKAILAPGCIVYSFLTFMPWFERIFYPLTIGFTCMAIITLYFALFLIDVEGGLGLSSVVGMLNLTFVLLFVFLLIGLPFKMACILGSLSTALYITSIALTFGLTMTTAMYSYPTLTVLALCALLGFFKELLLRRNYMASVRLAEEQRQTDNLLNKTIPSSAIAKLKEGQTSIVDSFGEVAILFSDIVGFTEMTTKVSPHFLIGVLERVFTEFDALAKARGVEKVKTIGDSYMAVAVPVDFSNHHIIQCVVLGFEMIDCITKISDDLGYPLSLRVGINIGPVIGGVLGSARPQYDYWGDTVNVASRLESLAGAGEVLISEAAYWRVRNVFCVEDRGELNAKGKGRIKAFRILPRAARDGQGQLVSLYG